jgi:hypothetical protein
MRGRKSYLLERCIRAGLAVGQWSPGDGITRYRFFPKRFPPGGSPEVDYHEGEGIFTALGIAEAEIFLRGYLEGRARGYRDGLEGKRR